MGEYESSTDERGLDISAARKGFPVLPPKIGVYVRSLWRIWGSPALFRVLKTQDLVGLAAPRSS